MSLKPTPLSLLIYQLFCRTYPLLLWMMAPFHPKARAWTSGRKNIFQKLESLRGKGPFVWVHCASLGEFEQGRPVIESIRANYPAHKILLTFFSPSGYENQLHYQGADFIHYLPMDGPQHAKRFIEIVDPKLVIFVKYEFWFYYLKKLHYRNIPLLLISAHFRPNMSFFHWYGALSRKMLSRFHHIFVQEEESKRLLADIGISENVSVSGDTRFDRVVDIASQPDPLPIIENFLANKRAIIVGSSWPTDEELWQETWRSIETTDLKLLIVPHEVGAAHVRKLRDLFPVAVLYSELEKEPSADAKVLIVDRIGLLSKLYRYGWVNYVGGGLSPAGVHNVLEAAVYERPVISGPFIEKYQEAVELVKQGGLQVLSGQSNVIELSQLLESWGRNDEITRRMGQMSGAFVRERTGTVKKILTYIQENRLLIN
ncbi:MAG: 3-deoxy-D-manno-octulosonic acid transferase [Bacteroidota bacterium]